MLLHPLPAPRPTSLLSLAPLQLHHFANTPDSSHLRALATASTLPGIPALHSFRGTLLVIVQVPAGLSPPQEDVPNDLIPRRDHVICHLSPFVGFFFFHNT